MSGEEMIRRLYQVINRGDIEALEEFMADDMVEHEEFPGLQPGKEGVLEFFRYLRTAFPDLRMTAEDVISEGDKVAVRGTMTGTHEGEFMDIPATGNRLELSFADFFRIEGGKVAEHWGATDTGALNAAVGERGRLNLLAIGARASKPRPWTGQPSTHKLLNILSSLTHDRE